MKKDSAFNNDQHRDLFYMFIINFFNDEVEGEDSIRHFTNPFNKLTMGILDLFPCEEYDDSSEDM